jgi:DNA-binding MarR family transcriptional regulator
VHESCHETVLPRRIDGVDDASSDVFRAFMGTNRAHRRLMMRMLGDRGIHPGQAMCLRLLAANEDIAQRDLAEALYVARPTVTKMLHSMEKAGLVQRHADSADQRLTRVRLTAAGRARETEMREGAAEYINSTIAGLPEAERRELTRLLDKLRAGIERATAEREAGTTASASPEADAPPDEAEKAS